MLVEVPFTYDAMVLIGRERQPRHVVVHDVTRADIPEVDGFAAPAIASLRLSKQAGRTRRSIRADIRSDGGFLEPVVNWQAENSAKLVTLESYASLASNGMKSLRHTVWPHLQHIAAFSAIEDLGSVRDVISDNRDAAERAAAAGAARARFVDGVLYRPSSEPVYVRDADGKVTSALLDTVRDKSKADEIYRADDPDPLLEYACSLTDPEQSRVLDRQGIDIFRPESLTWDRELELVRAAADALVERLPRFLIEAPASIVHLWVELRDQRAALSRDDLHSSIETLLNEIAGTNLPALVATEASRLLSLAQKPASEQSWRPA